MMNTRHRHHLLLGTALLTLVAGGLAGCKDFLKDASTPQGTLNDQTLLTANGVEGSLIAAYRAIEWNNGVGGAWGNAVSNWVWGSVTSDDAYKGSEASDQPPINDIEGYHWATGDAESYLSDKWRGVYEGVVRANATLRLLDQVRTDKPGEITDGDADRIRGEALFLRAHYHFEAWRMWGNIPYFTETDLDPRKTQTAPADVPALLLADLDEAISLLPTAQTQVGRANRWTAKAYKGRVQVYTGDYAGALTTLRDVQANGPYDLETSYDRVWTAFSSLENGKETILAYQASANDGEPNGNNANYGERLNFPHSGSPFGCCGFHQPSRNLVNFFAVDAVTGLPLALTSATWNASNATFVGGTLTPAVDPRLDWTVGRDDVPFKDWGLHEPGWIRSATYGGPYSPKKNIDEKAANAESKVGWVPTQLNSVNIHIYRYADMLLLLAEAEVEAGSLANALAIVNEIRTRAGVRAQGCGLPTDADAAAAELAKYPQCAGHSEMAVPINDVTITWATYRMGTYPAFATQNYARTAVRYERRLEMAMEGQRFFDLRRWGWAADTLNAYVAVEKNRQSYLLGAEAYAARHRWYPLPAVQIELSKAAGVATLVQNQGW